MVVSGGESTRKFGLLVKRESKRKFRGIFQILVELRGKFPELVNFLIHQKITLNQHWDIFIQLAPFPYLLHFEILREI